MLFCPRDVSLGADAVAALLTGRERADRGGDESAQKKVAVLGRRVWATLTQD